MIGYVTLGVRDLEVSKKFYTTLLNSKVLVDVGRLVMIGKDMAEPKIAVCLPFDDNDPSPGNGVMVAFPGGSREGVVEFYNKALELGAFCDGAPGQRIEGVFYGAYVKDPDGNKLCFFDFS